MNKMLLLLWIGVFFVSCQKRLYTSHPHCGEYFDYVKSHWERKDNGFFVIRADVDTSANAWMRIDAPPMFKQQWERYYENCLCQLSEKEVKLLFGKPTRITNTFRARDEIVIRTYGYHISDGKCIEELPKKNEPNKCSFLSLTFGKGKQFKGEKPVLSLY
jgi:hypothetical protein